MDGNIYCLYVISRENGFFLLRLRVRVPSMIASPLEKQGKKNLNIRKANQVLLANQLIAEDSRATSLEALDSFETVNSLFEEGG